MDITNFNKVYMNSVFAPPQWSKKFDNLSYILSRLAQANIVDRINKDTTLKAWCAIEEDGMPDIYIKDKGYIEVGTVNAGNPNVCIYNRKLKDYDKWDNAYGDKKLLLFFEIETGKMYHGSFKSIVEAIRAENDIFHKKIGDRGPEDIIYSISKNKLHEGLTGIENYFNKF